MAKGILITGGAGFIGSHLTNELLAHGHRVRILDSLIPQVHGEGQGRPAHLHPEAELIIGDVRDPVSVRNALRDVQVVFHLAARMGAGQSMYETAEYTSVSSYGTAVLLEHIARQRVERLIVASSVSVYGEGLYCTAAGCPATPVARTLAQLEAGDWEVRTAEGESLYPVPTPETKTPSLSSVYALSKFDQEQMCLIMGRAYGIPTAALRLWNAYGPHQTLSNPDTDVIAIFASRLLSGSAPLINEDGFQQRDFVSVYDVARAFRLAMESQADQQIFNVASGSPLTILELAGCVAHTLGRKHVKPVITGQYRCGDIRHCIADIQHARNVLDYKPVIPLQAGLMDLAVWLRGKSVMNRVLESRAELAERTLRCSGVRPRSPTRSVLITGGARS